LENATIGAMLLEPQTSPAVFSVIKSHHSFSSPQTSLAFVELRILHRRGVNATLEVLRDDLASVGLLECVGGERGLLEMVESTPNPNNALAYAQALLELGDHRECA